MPDRSSSFSRLGSALAETQRRLRAQEEEFLTNNLQRTISALTREKARDHPTYSRAHRAPTSLAGDNRGARLLSRSRCSSSARSRWSTSTASASSRSRRAAPLSFLHLHVVSCASQQAPARDALPLRHAHPRAPAPHLPRSTASEARPRRPRARARLLQFNERVAEKVKLNHEKALLENALEAEQECIVNKLQKQARGCRLPGEGARARQAAECGWELLTFCVCVRGAAGPGAADGPPAHEAGDRQAPAGADGVQSGGSVPPAHCPRHS